MSLRQLVAAASTIVVAAVLAISVPVSQLRTVSTQSACCCPDPDHCTCPDHDGDSTTHSTMRACHKTAHQFVSPVLPVFVPPVADVTLAPERALTAVVFSHPAPHAAPVTGRPDAPS